MQRRAEDTYVTGKSRKKKKSKLMKRKLIKTSSCHRQLLSSPATADLPLHMLLLPSNPQQQLTLIGVLVAAGCSTLAPPLCLTTPTVTLGNNRCITPRCTFRICYIKCAFFFLIQSVQFSNSVFSCST